MGWGGGNVGSGPETHVLPTRTSSGATVSSTDAPLVTKSSTILAVWQARHGEGRVSRKSASNGGSVLCS